MPDRQPDIDYPTQWEYRLIGRDAGGLRRAVAEAVEGEEHELRFARQSAKGKYLSLTLTLEVRNEAHRLRLWNRLAAHESVLRLL